jgi:TetR/AcrR family transcriptional regulator, copper-responsive repressor
MIAKPKKRGRPRAFDDDVVLARATETFLRFGYSGASLDALTTAMGLNKPSLYAAFGDKRGLFLRAIEDLAKKRGRRFRDAFERGTTLHDSLREMFLEGVEIYLEPEGAPGCLMVSGSTTEAVVDPGLAEVTREFFAHTDRALATMLATRVAGANAASMAMLARLTNGVIHDLALRARVGESRARLREHARGAAQMLSSLERTARPA